METKEVGVGCYLFWFCLIASLFCKSCEAFCFPCPLLTPVQLLHSYNLGYFVYLSGFETLLSSLFLIVVPP